MNVKPSDLAIVVPPSKNAGAIVKVLAFSGNEHFTGLPSWIVEASGGPYFVRLNDGSVASLNKKTIRLPDAWLRPVSGLPLDEETRDEVAA